MKVYQILALLLLTAGIYACGGSDPVERAAAEDEEMQRTMPEDAPQLKADAQFIKKYAEYTLFSMAAAEMAADRAVHPDVRSLAEEISKDHEEMFNRMQELATEYRLPVPDILSEELSQELEELRETEAQVFDQMYLRQVLTYHKAIQDEANSVIANSELEPIMDFARRIKSEQYIHLNRAQELAEELS